MIDYAEALTVIDVNTGSFTGRGKGRLEDTITKVNVEAAEEVVRQMRLRDIGGIIVIDFIDMAKAKNRDQVLKTLKKALDADKTKSYVMEVSPLGLVEMTRQNVTDGVREILTHTCPTCDGEGVVPLGRDDGDRGDPQAAPARRRRARARGVPDPGQPERRRGARLRGQRAGRARGGDRQALPLRGRRGARDRHLRGGRGAAAATRSRSGRCRSGSARRCWSRSRSRTCTTPTTRSPGSTPTSSASAAAARHVGERRLVRDRERRPVGGDRCPARRERRRRSRS